ncbi:hypothetical protein EJ03DRAFT_326646 [Teratosphaeria nubilosa]|uniref:Uncharacterized protein n=1 Tax=Teratosphaeria nubilosa TaxID=161662 RepID=A0A6G1LCE0_9PEZI|nr:hypothetical protein EJ03DRAFT_326646 [Teratosphaeria nubilosa]
MQFLTILALAGTALAQPYATGFGICPDATLNSCCKPQEGGNGNTIAAFCRVDDKTLVTVCNADEERKCCPKDGKTAIAICTPPETSP